MSGLELVAGIAGVAAAAIKVSVSMNDLAEELGSAGRDVRYIGNDMAGFSQVLRLVQSSLEESIQTTGSTVIHSVLDTLPQLVEQCGMVYDEANGLMIALKPSTKDSSISFFQRMKFVFYKGRITILRSLLDSSKSTLNLLLVTLNIEMAKSKSPDKALMEQLQNERKAFIRVVHSQNKALDEAMKEVEKAKKEAAKFKTKRDKEKEKENKETQNDQGARPEELIGELPKRNSTPYSYKPPPPYTLHSAPSVSQLVYQPPSLERFNSVRKSSKAVTTLALSLEPATPTTACGMPTPPSSPPENNTYRAYSPFMPDARQSPHSYEAESEKASEPSNIGSETQDEYSNQQKGARPEHAGKRVFSDPGPGQSRTASNEHLNPGTIPRERSRSPYGFSRAPQSESPKVEKKRASFSTSPNATDTSNSAHTNYRTFSTPTYGHNGMGSVPEEKEPAPTGPSIPTPSPATEQRKPSFTYYPPPPPPPPTYTDPEHNDTSPPPSATTNTPRKPSMPPPPPPRHGISYIVLEPYLSHEIGHLSLVPFDTLVDVVAYTPEEVDLPYPTAFDTNPKHFWQASLGNRRGPRGLFPVDVVCPVDDDKVTQKMSQSWFAEKDVSFIADAVGRCWVGPAWEFSEPLRRRSKWWAEEF